ncbi:MAG TPA: M23 family metallopeptidase [Myxococcaceae bacterium]|nr:M23 family metallopeptidase [Myxococcaceae bacterium]
MRRPPLLCLLLTIAASPALAKDRRPSLEVRPGAAKPGDLLMLTVADAKARPSGTAAGRQLYFFPSADGFRALVPLPVEIPPGELSLQVFLPAASEKDGAVTFDANVEVIDPAFPARTLTVDRKFTDPPPAVKKWMADDRKAFAQVFSRPAEPPRFNGPFAWPRTAVVTAPFGDRRVFNGKQQSQHYGVDLDGVVGAPVNASNDGEVVMVRDCYGSGQTVVIHHGAELYTLYFHLSEFAVKPGDRVKRGERVGKVGMSGRVTGPHLHWAVKVAGLYVNGESLLSLPF